MTWLIAVICILVVVIFWRISLPIAVTAAVALVLFILHVRSENRRSAQTPRQAGQAAQQKIAAPQEPPSVAREWQTVSQRDPASGKDLPRYARVVSDDGL